MGSVRGAAHQQCVAPATLADPYPLTDQALPTQTSAPARLGRLPLSRDRRVLSQRAGCGPAVTHCGGYAPDNTNRSLPRSCNHSTIGASGKTERPKCAQVTSLRALQRPVTLPFPVDARSTQRADHRGSPVAHPMTSLLGSPCIDVLGLDLNDRAVVPSCRNLGGGVVSNSGKG